MIKWAFSLHYLRLIHYDVDKTGFLTWGPVSVRMKPILLWKFEIQFFDFVQYLSIWFFFKENIFWSVGQRTDNWRQRTNNKRWRTNFKERSKSYKRRRKSDNGRWRPGIRRNKFFITGITLVLIYYSLLEYDFVQLCVCSVCK